MSSHDRCHRCQELSTLANARGSLYRCPLCRGQLIKTADATYRVDSDVCVSGQSAGWRRLGPMIVGVVAAFALVGVLIAAICYATLRSVEHSRLITAGRLSSAESANWSDFTTPPETPKVQPVLAEVYAPRNVQPARTIIHGTVSVAAAPQRTTPAETIPVSVSPDEPRVPTKFLLEPYSEQYTLVMLDQVPEVSIFDSVSPIATKDQAATVAAEYRKEIKKLVAHEDKLIEHLIKTRSNLTGLPFRLGKDCQLADEQSKNLAEYSRAMRGFLSNEAPRSSIGIIERGFDASHAQAFVQAMAESHKFNFNSAVPAFHQILSGESAPMRMALVATLRKSDSKEAAQALANRAVFDPSPEVRNRAIEALKDANPVDFSKVLVDAMNYPFPPAISNAADALVTLKVKGAVGELIEMLDEPGAHEPRLKKVDGREYFVQRELVRINHLRNCLLCHAPAGDLTAGGSRARVNFAIATTPVLGDELPPRLSQVYYSGRRGDVFVRADITYLKQDFSALQYVNYASPWPNMQRFDFLVRERELTGDELDAWQLQQALQQHTPRPLAENQRAILFVLQNLTGENFGLDQVAWNTYLKQR